MRKKTSTIMALVIATILTAYISALTLSNHAFAQPGQIPISGDGNGGNGGSPSGGGGGASSITSTIPGQVGGGGAYSKGWIVDTGVLQALAGHEAQLGKILAGHEAQLGKILGKAGLGDVCLSCFGH
jgi:hypothetical protein